jgi:Mg/Co/Ni transporter MgtE
VPGKADWLARALPTEGRAASRPRAATLALDDVVTCRLGDRVRDVAPRVEASPYSFALVTTERGTVLGRLRASAMAEAGDADSAESLMEPGPSTVRADLEPDKLADRLDKRGFRVAVVTTPEGRLIGVVQRDDL